MSYRIEVKNSSYLKALIAGFGFSLIFSIWALQKNLLTAIPYLYSYLSINTLSNIQIVIQLACSLFVVHWTLRQVIIQANLPVKVIQLKQNGDLQIDVNRQLTITNKSLIGPFFCWLTLIDKISGIEQRLIIFKDAVTEQEFHRICRITKQKKAPDKAL